MQPDYIIGATDNETYLLSTQNASCNIGEYSQGNGGSTRHILTSGTRSLTRRRLVAMPGKHTSCSFVLRLRGPALPGNYSPAARFSRTGSV